jgi:hypothetical protein
VTGHRFIAAGRIIIIAAAAGSLCRPSPCVPLFIYLFIFFTFIFYFFFVSYIIGCHVTRTTLDGASHDFHRFGIFLVSLAAGFFFFSHFMSHS